MTKPRGWVVGLVLGALLGAPLVGPGAVRAADPGLLIPGASEASDQKPGSILFFNLLTSSGGPPASHDTRVSLTNTSLVSAAFNRLFVVNGATGQVSGVTVCLTANQTASFNAADVAPGVTGYLLSVAVSGVNGCPTAHNFMTGQAHVRTASGHQGTLPAVALAAQFSGGLPGCDANSVTAALAFNGVSSGYNLVPRVLALPEIPSLADGARTLLVFNRVGGNLSTGVSSVGAFGGALYDDAENQFLWGQPNPNAPQFVGELSNAFPVTVPPFTTAIPSGRTGWLKLFSQTPVGYVGAVLYREGPAALAHRGASPAFGASNLPGLTLNASDTYLMPVSPPSC